MVTIETIDEGFHAFFMDRTSESYEAIEPVLATEPVLFGAWTLRGEYGVYENERTSALAPGH